MTTEVLFDVSALTFVEHTDVSAFGLASVGVRSTITSTDWVNQVWVTTTFVGFIISQAFSFVVNGDTLASSFACVLIGVAISTADGESDISTRVASRKRTSGSSVAIITWADTVLIFLRSGALKVALVIVSKTVSGADWSLQTFTMRAMGGLSFGAFTGLPELFLCAFHEASILVGLSFSGADRFVDIGTVARVETGTLVLDHLVTTLNSAFVFVGGTILTTDWSELI